MHKVDNFAVLEEPGKTKKRLLAATLIWAAAIWARATLRTSAQRKRRVERSLTCHWLRRGPNTEGIDLQDSYGFGMCQPPKINWKLRGRATQLTVAIEKLGLWVSTNTPKPSSLQCLAGAIAALLQVLDGVFCGSVNSGNEVHPSRKVQIAHLKADNDGIPALFGVNMAWTISFLAMRSRVRCRRKGHPVFEIRVYDAIHPEGSAWLPYLFACCPEAVQESYLYCHGLK